jgi:DNA-binding response OmpR family regulator
MAKILVVEDVEDWAQLIARELKACSYEVFVADNGLSALELQMKQHPDLIILDWGLPLLDGLEVLRKLRQHSATPILMVTGRAEEIDRVLGLEVGADDYLVKPFSTRELIARIRAILRRVELIQNTLKTEPKTIPPLSYGPLRVDPQTFTVHLRDERLDLSRTEFDLLCLFLQFPGQAFERSYLMETVWGETYVEHDRSVDNTIHRLRRKLKTFGESIETVHGVGYRLRVD